MTLPSPAIACTLGTDDFKDRVAGIAALNARHLLRKRREDLVLVLTYDLAARSEVAELMAREQTCCAFLKFDMRETDAAVELSVRVPEAARQAADALLEPFLGGLSSTPSPQCGGSCSAPPLGMALEPISDPASGWVESGGKVGVTAATLATVALACGICCVVPIALPGVALGGLGAMLAWVGNAYAAVTAIASLLVVAAWIWVYRDATRRNARPAAATLWLMGLASVVLVAALAWPRLEPAVANLLVAGK